MRRVAIVVLLVTIAASSPAAARTQVNRRRPPRIAVLFHGDVLQRATPYTFCWSYSNGDGTGTGMCADGFPDWPRAASVPLGGRVTIRIHYPLKPERWRISAYRAVTRDGDFEEPVGDPERIDYRLHRHRVDGQVRAWDLIFRVDEMPRDYYIDTYGDLRQGDAYYALHVRGDA